MSPKAVLFVATLLVSGPVWSEAQKGFREQLSLNYPLVDHPVYPYYSRLEATDEIPLFSGTRPFLGHMGHSQEWYSSARTRELLRHVREGAARDSLIDVAELTGRSDWRRLINHLPFGLSKAGWLYPDGIHAGLWRYDKTFSAAIQPLYGLDVIHTDDERGTITRFAGGLRVEGGYGRRLHYLVDFRDYTEAGNGPYRDRAGLVEDRWASVELSGKNSTSYDISESFLQYYGRDLSVTVGRGRNQWGPAQFGSLFLNSAMPPFDYFRFDAVLRPSRGDRAVFYTFLHGNLESQVVAESLYVNPDGRPRTLNAQKYLSAQRLEVRPRGNLLFGFSQSVVYGDRGVQLGYATPVSFLYSIQHAMDDKDNMMLGLDTKWRPVAGVIVYGEALFDDIVVSELTTSSGNNKSAYTVGAKATGTRGVWSAVSATAEYTRVRPFVYSHIFSANVYTHWTSPLGYTREPNSEFITYELRTVPYPIQVALTYSRQNHGANVMSGDSLVRNVGGNLENPLFGAEKARSYPFLDGRLERITRISLAVDWEGLPSLHLRARGTIVEESGREQRLETVAGFGWNL